MIRPERLVSELKRRKVFRVAAVYVVAAWVVLQVGDVIIEPLRLPPWTMTLLIVLVGLGLPLAVVLAWAFELTPDGVRRTEGGESPGEPGAEQPPPSQPAFYARRSTWFVAGILVALTGAWFLLDDRGAPAGSAIDANTVVVLPFRTAGAAAELQYLREGMVDLLATKLTGEVGPRAVDPHRIIPAWRDRLTSQGEGLPLESALDLARGMGAGQLLTGTIVGTAGNVIISGSLHDAASGRERARGTVEGSPDSLTALVDRLAGTLLALEAGAEQSDLASYTSESLPALRAYLRGQAAYRDGRYEAACDAFRGALASDSTFALAALGLSLTAGWLPACVGEGANRIVWAYRDRLSSRDRAFAIAWVGSRYPAPTPAAVVHADWRRVVQAMPDRPDAWFHLADRIYHAGAILGIDDWRERAAENFGRAMALDSTNAENYIHLVPLLLTLGRLEEAIRLGERFLERDSSDAGTAGFLRWHIALARGDTAGLARIRENFDGIGGLGLPYIFMTSLVEGRAIEDGERALEIWGRQPTTPSDHRTYLMLAYIYEIVAGRPEAAVPIGRELERVVSDSDWPIHLRLLTALYGDGDEADGAAALARLTRDAEAPAAADPEERASQLHALCTVAQWRVWRGEALDADRAARRLRDAGELPGGGQRFQACAMLIEALAAALGDHPDAAPRAAALDTLLETGPAAWLPGEPAVLNLAAARIHLRNGDVERALAAVRRRLFWGPASHLLFAEALELEGDLALELGRRDEAIRAYRHYLALRDNAEPALEEQVARVRSALAALVTDEGTPAEEAR